MNNAKAEQQLGQHQKGKREGNNTSHQMDSPRTPACQVSAGYKTINTQRIRRAIVTRTWVSRCEAAMNSSPLYLEWSVCGSLWCYCHQYMKKVDKQYKIILRKRLQKWLCFWVMCAKMRKTPERHLIVSKVEFNSDGVMIMSLVTGILVCAFVYVIRASLVRSEEEDWRSY